MHLEATGKSISRQHIKNQLSQSDQSAEQTRMALSRANTSAKTADPARLLLLNAG